MALIYARPADGLTLPLPDGRPWPAEGAWVDTAERYIRRRLADGDVVEVAPPATTSSPAVAPAPADQVASDDGKKTKGAA
ncbi:DUF2635 domain-containing protein [Segnochrobactrum spirostomi]|uniref:DUF2635 domain-containing protein n=1 Tax=Segnochrobactrum spirostomi TaxID=2608987 RepID=UPI001295B48F|nr:DUF2635 domain-containing protein [Segnochrobactrum spirostomi]